MGRVQRNLSPTAGLRRALQPPQCSPYCSIAAPDEALRVIAKLPGDLVVVGAIHPKAMPVILTTSDEVETWMSAAWDEASKWLRSPKRNDLGSGGQWGGAEAV